MKESLPVREVWALPEERKYWSLEVHSAHSLHNCELDYQWSYTDKFLYRSAIKMEPSYAITASLKLQ